MNEYTVDKFFDQFFSLDNPILYAVLFVFIFLLILYLIRIDVIQPMKKRHLEKTKKLQHDYNARMALFADLDSDPLFRIDLSGKILMANQASLNLSENGEVVDKNIFDILPVGKMDINELINSNRSEMITREISGRYYSIEFKGIEKLNAAHVYLHDITTRVEAEKKLNEYQKYLSRKEEDSKKQIAKELHDSIGQSLLFMKLDIQKLDGGNDYKLTEMFEPIYSNLDSVNKELREICNSLSPRVLEHQGLAAALDALISQVNKRQNINGSLKLHGEDLDLDYDKELEIFRIVQEAISNIVKHSNADQFEVSLINSGTALMAVISDNGNGFVVEDRLNDKKGGFGLMNMIERAENINGNLNFESEPGRGTSIIFNLELNPK